MNLEFTVTETITRLEGHVLKLSYEIEEITIENVSQAVSNKKERRSRIYNVDITNEQYRNLARRIPDALPFDDFIFVVRPFIMGYYEKLELEQAFNILDRDRSGSIHIDELSVFLPIINEHATSDRLKTFFHKTHTSADEYLDYAEFQTLVLKGVGRDIICNSI